ncbi:MAG: hypothetical protein WBB27_07025 [Maribacter sp.]
MSVIESLNDTSNKAVDVGEEFYRKTKAFYKLKIFQQLASTTGMFCKILVVGSLAFLGFLFFIIALTVYLAEVLESGILACVSVGSLLIALSVILYLVRKRIDNLIVSKLSNKFFDK